MTIAPRARDILRVVIADACRAIDTGGSLATAWSQMRDAGVTAIEARDLAA